MPAWFERALYGMVILSLVMGIVSGMHMVVAPKAFINLQRRLHAMIGFPTELLEPAWRRFPVRLMGALYLPFCIAGLYYLLVVNPAFFEEFLADFRVPTG